MTPFARVGERLRRMPRLSNAINDSRGLINTTDLLVATAATVILAAGVGSAAISTVSDAKYGKAQPDAQAMGNAITQFYKDTGKWPGQAEHSALAGGSGGTTGPLFLVTSTTTSTLPDDAAVDSAGTVTEHGALTVAQSAVCANNSGQGFVGVTISAGRLGNATLKNINDYLVRKPADTDYPNWKGPYLQEDIKTDPWDRAWVINLQPLYCSEAIVGTTSTNDGTALTAGFLGYAWLVSGGANRTITTQLSSTHLDSTGDDAGINLGKLVKPGISGTNSQ